MVVFMQLHIKMLFIAGNKIGHKLILLNMQVFNNNRLRMQISKKQKILKIKKNRVKISYNAKITYCIYCNNST